jgi:hypothetical protein
MLLLHCNGSEHSPYFLSLKTAVPCVVCTTMLSWALSKTRNWTYVLRIVPLCGSHTHFKKSDYNNGTHLLPSRRLGFSSDRNITKRLFHPVWSCCWHAGTRSVLPNLHDAIFACHLNGQFCFTNLALEDAFNIPFYKTTKMLQREVFTLRFWAMFRIFLTLTSRFDSNESTALIFSIFAHLPPVPFTCEFQCHLVALFSQLTQVRPLMKWKRKRCSDALDSTSYSRTDNHTSWLFLLHE